MKTENPASARTGSLVGDGVLFSGKADWYTRVSQLTRDGSFRNLQIADDIDPHFLARSIVPHAQEKTVWVFVGELHSSVSPSQSSLNETGGDFFDLWKSGDDITNHRRQWDQGCVAARVLSTRSRISGHRSPPGCRLP